MDEKRTRLPKLKQSPSFDDIERVGMAIKSYIHQTPIVSSKSLDEIVGCRVFFKCETLQKGGAFKIRGALSAALSLTDEELKKGIVTHSSGNHAQGVALTAKILNTSAYIVMPHNSSSVKMRATEEYGANITMCEPNIESRVATAKKLQEKKDLSFISPYNDYHVIAGQGTIALEFLKKMDDLNFLLAPVSGGGLLAGTSIIAKEISKRIEVIGVEPNKADDAYRSFYSKKLKSNKTTSTICDALRGNLGDKTFPIILDNVDEIITVKEKNIIKAMRLIWERLNLVCEPSSAVPLAAIIENKKYFKNKKVGIILTGANLNLQELPF